MTIDANFATLRLVPTTLTIVTCAWLRSFASVLCAVLVVSCQPSDRWPDSPRLEELRISVSEPREISFTNKQAGFYYTLTHGDQTSGWHGWHVFSRKILDDYGFSIDGRALLRDDVVRSDVYPHLFTRTYRNGIRETVTLLDSIDALVVELAGLRGDSLVAWPLYGDAHSRDDFIVEVDAGAILVARAGVTRRVSERDPPPWIGMRLLDAASGAWPLLEAPGRPGRFAPGGVATPLTGDSATVFVVAGDTPDACISLLDELRTDFQARIARRKARMESVLRLSHVRTDDERLTKALHWAMLSLDALQMHQERAGIFAGLPWFSNYWGRDTFIALPGATLVTGRYEEAREILRSFALWQEKDPSSSSYGRIPNLVTPQSIAYNTADGTPWFVIALEKYWRASADTAFVQSLLPVLTRSIQGTIDHHTDRDGFLTHGDAETWMDAVGPDGPWSPRGNRANDIQWLWYRQLLAGAALTQDSMVAQDWRRRAANLRSSFLAHFVDTSTGLVSDHLHPDGTSDGQIRPNQFFVFSSSELLVDARSGFHAATSALVYPHGVASLSQDDENFHPFHHYQPYYVQDAAYHNGIVWTWLAGPWIDAAVRLGYQSLAYSLTNEMTHQILDRGAVGTMSELLEALPREGEAEPRLSGTFSQAWSLAEYIRVFFEDYLGISLNVPQSRLRLSPRLPRELHHVSTTIRFGSWVIPLEMRSAAGTMTLSLSSPGTAPAIALDGDLESSPGTRWLFEATLTPGSTSEFIASDGGVLCRVGTALGIIEQPVAASRVTSSERTPPPFATPRLQPRLRALQSPGHTILPHALVKASNPKAQVIFEGSDPAFDDRGTGSFVYPTNGQLKAGSLDLRHARVTSDSSMVYVDLRFRNLSNPGWHPEYGFQLTYVALAIDADRKPSSGQRHLGWNSNVVLEQDFSFERLILVGGGIRVLDAQSAVLGEYLPAPGDERNPLGDAAAGTISFALPRNLLGIPKSGARIGIFVGAQDDHGGVGLGEFRTVSAKAGEWTGGGRRQSSDPNVYDTLILEQTLSPAFPHN